ncbi:hypothetical protein V8G54_023953 [Vigna mungo]|uniref:Bet v I/Major latex protein domain-containing protein n=1 Tax=Vigna mungo TaxID=3915 RepID=A0AAQ3N5A4_VIGMU
MSLTGKITTELPIDETADEWFDTFRNQFQHIQDIVGNVHGARLLQGDDWHANDSVKHWTYTVAIDHKYKVFNLTFEAIEKDDGSAAIKWSIEYEKVSEDVHPPYGYLEFYDHVTKDVDAHLVKAPKNATK